MATMCCPILYGVPTLCGLTKMRLFQHALNPEPPVYPGY